MEAVNSSFMSPRNGSSLETKRTPVSDRRGHSCWVQLTHEIWLVSCAPRTCTNLFCPSGVTSFATCFGSKLVALTEHNLNLATLPLTNDQAELTPRLPLVGSRPVIARATHLSLLAAPIGKLPLASDVR